MTYVLKNKVRLNITAQTNALRAEWVGRACEFFARKFGGFTQVNATGGWLSTDEPHPIEGGKVVKLGDGWLFAEPSPYVEAGANFEEGTLTDLVLFIKSFLNGADQYAACLTLNGKVFIIEHTELESDIEAVCLAIDPYIVK